LSFALAPELVNDVAGVTKRPGEPVALGDSLVTTSVAGPAGRERLTHSGSGAVRAGEAVIDVDPVGLHPPKPRRSRRTTYTVFRTVPIN